MNETLRLNCINQRKQLTQQEQIIASEKICEQILELKAFETATFISLYKRLGREIDLNAVYQTAISRDKQCYFPIVNSDLSLTFLPAKSDTLFYKGQYGVEEPSSPKKLARSPQEFDIMLLPLVAFDVRGVRLGMGLGCYDRTLAQGRPKLLLGVAYEFQRQEYIEANSWDVLLDGIVTEQQIYWSAR